MSKKYMPQHKKQTTAICIGDCCQDAVKRAYKEMQSQDVPDLFALDAALSVFHWYHPNVATSEAEQIVSHWVYDGAVH